MKKLSLLLIAMTFLVVSCNNSAQKTKANSKPNPKDQSTLKATPEVVTTVTIANFNENADSLVGKTVVIEGIVDHVCKHGGQKMILIAQNTENRVKITPNEKIAAFKPELEGEDVKVTGVVEEMKVDENYLSKWEDEVNEELAKKKDKGIHKGKEGKENTEVGQMEEEDAGQSLKQIENLRKKLKESGKDHLSYYSVVCSKYEVVKNSDSENR